MESDFWTSSGATSGRFLIHTLLGGVGINQPVGRRSSVNFMVLWALTNNDYGLYDNPEIRMGFNF